MIIEAAYTPVARILHWVTAILVLAIIPIGVVMTNVGNGPLQDFLFRMHESIGALLIPIIGYRLIYRLTHPPLPLPAEIPAIQRLAAEGLHWALYALLIAQPIIGWIATSSYRSPILVFGLFELPPIWPENRAFSEKVTDIHGAIGFIIGALLCAHIGAALFHHFVRKDRVLSRMVTG
jgi:cytochrome b561